MPRSVLIIEDEVDLLGHLVHSFLIEGMDVHYAHNGFHGAEELDALMATGGIDCILVDLHMPGMGGIDLLRKARSIGFEFPVIFLSHENDMEIRAEAKELGIATFLDKPLDETLVRLVAKATAVGRDFEKELHRLLAG